jgi:hypothetical protein
MWWFGFVLPALATEGTIHHARNPSTCFLQFFKRAEKRAGLRAGQARGKLHDGGMRTLLILMASILWMAPVHAQKGDLALKKALEEMEAANTELGVEGAFDDGALGISGDPNVKLLRPLLESAREEHYKRVQLPWGIRVTHSGVKPGRTAQGKDVPAYVFGFEVTGKYPVAEVWGKLAWFNAEGEVVSGREQCFYAAESLAEAIPTGKSHINQMQDFFLEPGNTKVAHGVQVIIAITKVVHVQK